MILVRCPVSYNIIGCFIFFDLYAEAVGQVVIIAMAASYRCHQHLSNAWGANAERFFDFSANKYSPYTAIYYQ